MTYTSCKTCALRRDCWILNINEYRSPLGNPYFTYEMALQAIRGECLLYTEEEV